MLERTRNIDVAFIYQLYTERAEAFNARDVERWAALWAENAFLMPPGSRRKHGTQSIANAFDDLNNRPRQIVAFQPDEVRILGHVAYVYGGLECSSISAEGNLLARRRGKFLDILEKQSDGSWKFAIDCFNFDYNFERASNSE